MDASGLPLPPATDASELFRRIRQGDRAAAGEFVLNYGPLLRRRISGKMGWRVRRVFDSADILSTVLRRLDSHIAHQHAGPGSEQEMWGLVLKILDAAVIDKVRLVTRLKRADGEDVLLTEALLARMEDEHAGPGEPLDALLDRAFAALESDDDRRLLWLWLSGTELKTIAVLLGINPGAARQRWKRIKERLHDTLS